MAGICPGFTFVPGAHANYQAGRNALQASIAHFTAGAYGGDRAVGLRGYFNGYAPRDLPPEQYSPVDALDFGACEWNPRVTHLEVEKRDGNVAMTDLQIASCGKWVAFCATLGIPKTYHDDPAHRIPVGGALPAGHVSHRSLHEQKCDEHYDYWTADEWVRILAAAGGSPGTPTIEDDEMAWSGKLDDGQHIFVSGIFFHRVDPATVFERNNAALGPARVEFRGGIPRNWLDDMIDADALKTGAPVPGGGVSDAQLEAAATKGAKAALAAVSGLKVG